MRLAARALGFTVAFVDDGIRLVGELFDGTGRHAETWAW